HAKTMGYICFALDVIRVVSCRTDKHLMIIDITKSGITGKDAQNLLYSVHITTHQDSIPGDQRSPFVTSGLRIGTPAIISRGFDEADAKKTAEMIIEILSDPENSATIAHVKEEVQALTKKHPIE